MAIMTEINHVALIVDDIEKATEFYVNEFKLERIPAFDFDYPTEFLKINDRQQIHLTEWEIVIHFADILVLLLMISMLFIGE